MQQFNYDNITRICDLCGFEFKVTDDNATQEVCDTCDTHNDNIERGSQYDIDIPFYRDLDIEGG